MISLDSWEGEPSEVALLRRCKEAIRRVVPDADVILYGSRARGQAHEHSDYDILIVVNGPVDMALREEILSAVYPLELDTGALLTLLTYDKRQWNSPLYCAMPFHKNVEREGILL